MKSYVLRRLWQAVLVLFGVSVVVFMILHLTGDPAALLLPPAGLAARFVGLPGTSAAASLLAWVGYSAIVPLALALLARALSRRDPFTGPLPGVAAGLAFGWAGLLLHTALVRSVHLPWLPALLVPIWLAGNAVVSWFAGRGLLAREGLR